ncbi:Crp/Fnr family transcriptional regulator [Carboxylicivirga caseinilyticus]|uniref:Crp/Fnr family transcriptional regulator n=1 Tax=Carboxylicivirga caseinilyticus TaxID=3417572 RepID=UPI003D350500|nr:Crp/Fnr family transcriptional regulator [Marinilabiliaceae bacterium A049]
MKDLQKYITTYFGISEDDMQKVAALFKETELKKGDYFLKIGQYCDKLSFVQSGYVRIYSTFNNKEVTQWISTKGYFITELNSFIFKQRARYNMQALTDCKLFTIEKDNYNLLNKILPNWPVMEKQFIAGCFITLEDRVFNHLSLTAEERYEQFFQQNKELFNQVPLQYIASMLGMSAETFSRIRNKKIS